MAKFAERTKVPVSQSRAEIQKLIERYGATEFVFGFDQDRSMFQFSMKGFRARIEVPLPQRVRYESDAKYEQRGLSRWRAVVLVLKAKLESIENEIERFEQAFMPYLVLPNGGTVGEFMVPQIERAYATQEMPPMLPAPPKNGESN